MNIDKSLPIDWEFIDDPKNESSFGEVDMPEWYMRELKEFYHQWKIDKLKVGDLWKGGDRQFIFHSGFGEPYYPSTTTRTWAKFLKRNKFRHIRLHHLRHTSGSLLFEAGEQMKSIQERLRHSREQTICDIYVHVSKKKKKQTAKAFDKFDPKASGTSLAPTSENEVN
ncbi:tyrosine-type recombinase/integrase [Paenibacillus oleatilyticus]|uniref:tyrosine-type recombinase/integrase n=1 Tax=Paenibacillus oleatilyticus TaxID=2594886 RepID=UPI001C1F7DE9|nr:tyrosine-type recombinase/integrase [Paenibacillus oleatilyticus]MBU7318646.1 tyrosine-type recombinase/integrase [Paenibacillus oleatilyticus]